MRCPEPPGGNGHRKSRSLELRKYRKDENEGGSDLSSRTFQFTPKIRDLYGAEVYTRSNAKPTRFTPLCLAIWSFRAAETPNSASCDTKKCGPFSAVSSRYLDRGRV